METKTIKRFLKLIWEYQKINNIQNMSVSNAQYLYDFIGHNYPKLNPEVRAVICVYANRLARGQRPSSQQPLTTEIQNIAFHAHMVVIIDDQVFDPSYEIAHNDNVLYIDSWSTLTTKFKITEDMIKTILPTFLEFVKASDEMNKGVPIISNGSREFYNKQADYVEENWKR